MPVYYDFNRGGQAALKAEAFSYFLVSSAKVSPFFRRPPNYAKLFAIGTSLLAFLAAAVFAWPFVSGAIGSRYLWACLTLVSPSPRPLRRPRAEPSTSAALHPADDVGPNVERDPASALHDDQQGGPAELLCWRLQQPIRSRDTDHRHHLCVLPFMARPCPHRTPDATLAFTAYTLTFTIAKLEDAGRQRAAVYIWGGVLLFVASLLVSVFRIKKCGPFPPNAPSRG